MTIRISRPEVLHNLVRFKDNLLELESRRSQTERRMYRALFNRKTGDLRFPAKISNVDWQKNRLTQKIVGDWEEIQIDVDTKHSHAHFEAADATHRPLEKSAISPVAWRILEETVKTLNLLSEQHHVKNPETLPEEYALEHLSEIRISAADGHIEEMEGWKGALNRTAAEKLLQKASPGAYVLREAEPVAEEMVKFLGASNRMYIRPFLCTFLEGNKKITDALLLDTDQGWTIYQDNPNLFDTVYIYSPSPQALILSQLAGKAKFPLQG